jgi:hypothetical protein
MLMTRFNANAQVSDDDDEESMEIDSADEMY